MRTLRVGFDNGRDVALAASLDLPREGSPRAYAIFAHCFTCNRNYKFIRQMARTLAQQGLAVLRLDFAGLGDSGGRFEETNFSTSVADVLAAADFLAAEHRAPGLLIGHSLGGAAVLAAAPDIASVRAVAAINSPSTPAQVLTHFDAVDEAVTRQGYAEAEIGGIVYRLTPQLIDDLRRARIDSAIAALDAALLVLHATQDRTADISHGERIFAAAAQPKSMIALPGTDHLLSREGDAQYAAALIAAWSTAYLNGA